MVLLDITKQVKNNIKVKNEFESYFDLLSKELKRYSDKSNAKFGKEKFKIDDLLETLDSEHPLLQEKFKPEIVQFINNYLKSLQIAEIRNLLFELLNIKFNYDKLKKTTKSSDVIKKVLYIFIVLIIVALVSMIVFFSGKNFLTKKSVDVNTLGAITSIVGLMIIYATYIVKVPLKQLNDRNINLELRKFNLLDSTTIDFEQLADLYSDLEDETKINNNDRKTIANMIYQYVTNYVKLNIGGKDSQELIRQIQIILDREYNKFLKSNNIDEESDPEFIEKINELIVKLKEDLDNTVPEKKDNVINEFFVGVKKELLDEEVTKDEWAKIKEDILIVNTKNPDYDTTFMNIVLDTFKKIDSLFQEGSMTPKKSDDKFLSFSQFSKMISGSTFKHDFYDKYSTINSSLEKIININEVSGFFKNKKLQQGFTLGFYILLIIVSSIFIFSFVSNNLGFKNIKDFNAENIFNNILILVIVVAGFIFASVVILAKWNNRKNILDFNSNIYERNIRDLKQSSYKLESVLEKIKETKSITVKQKKELYNAVIELLSVYSNLNFLRNSNANTDDNVPMPIADIIINIMVLLVVLSLGLFTFIKLNPYVKADNIVKLSECVSVMINPSSSTSSKQQCKNIFESIISNTNFIKFSSIILVLIVTSGVIVKIVNNTLTFNGKLYQSYLFTNKKTYDI